MMLFFKECKRIFLSLSFWIYCIFVVLVFSTQYYSDCKWAEEKPSPNWDDYGYKVVENHDLIMDGALNTLMTEYSSNRYECYPYGFIKNVSLKEKGRNKIKEYLMEITGTDENGFADVLAQGQEGSVIEGVNEYDMIFFENLEVDKSVSYERFTEILGDIDDILGGGSEYAVDSLAYKYSLVPMTYEDALEEYNTFINEDKITGALSRLFCDYTGIDLALIPVFVAAALITADKRHRMNELVYSRKISSFRLLFTRFTALVTMMFIPVLITMVVALIQAMINYNGMNMNISVMFTLPTFWLLPEIMVVTAVGILLTELFSAGTAIIVQCVWAYYSLMKGGVELSGFIGKFDLICRHNTLVKRDVFISEQGNFIFNRVFFIILSLAVMLLAVWIFSLKRGGKLNEIKLFGKGGLFRRKA